MNHLKTPFFFSGYLEYREAVAAYRDAVKKAYRDMQQDGEHEKGSLV